MHQAMIFDLDGTLYRGAAAIPGAADFVGRARDQGWTPLFMTNRANRAAAVVAGQLRGMGIPCEDAEVFTSGQATAASLDNGRIFVIGEAPLRDLLVEAGFTLADQAVDTVLVSLDQAFDYRKLTQAVRLIRGGARFVATNPDKALLLDEGWCPGTGAIVAAVAAAAGCSPRVIGKPERRMVDLALQRLGVPADRAVMIGDNIETDTPAAAAAGVRSVLMLTGVSTRDDARGAAVQATWVAADYAELTALFDGMAWILPPAADGL
jgi:HAD superfamily hydrolase (TIGR01457 family)